MFPMVNVFRKICTSLNRAYLLHRAFKDVPKSRRTDSMVSNWLNDGQCRSGIGCCRRASWLIIAEIRRTGCAACRARADSRCYLCCGQRQGRQERSRRQSGCNAGISGAEVLVVRTKIFVTTWQLALVRVSRMTSSRCSTRRLGLMMRWCPPIPGPYIVGGTGRQASRAPQFASAGHADAQHDRNGASGRCDSG